VASIRAPNTLEFGASSTPTPDVISFAQTISHDGRVELLTENDSSAFVVALQNIGSIAPLEISASLATPALPIDLSWCRTNPITSACVEPIHRTNTPIAVTPASGEAVTLAVFAKSNGKAAFEPASNRVLVTVRSGDRSISTTSIAPFTSSAQQIPDLGFGVRGAALPVSPEVAQISNYRAMLQQDDGKVVTGSRHLITRHNQDGSPDTSFGDNGRVVESSEYAGIDAFRTLMIQADNKIVAVGGPKGRRVWRYDAQGELDASFVQGGLDLSESTDYFDPTYSAIAQLPAGKLLVAGSVEYHPNRPPSPRAGQPRVLLITRLNKDGTVNSEFGDNGAMFLEREVVYPDFGAQRRQSREAVDIEIYQDGSAVVLGAVGHAALLVILTPAGALDTGVSTDGTRVDYCIRGNGPLPSNPLLIMRTVFMSLRTKAAAHKAALASLLLFACVIGTSVRAANPARKSSPPGVHGDRRQNRSRQRCAR